MADLAAAYVACDELFRAQDRDRWLAGLFLPDASRARIAALYAFNVEIARIREIVREPLSGEIRLQWWRDVLAGERTGEAQAHPIAAALLDTVETFALPRAALINLVDARVFDLYDDAMPTQNDLEGYCGETCSVLFQLVAAILGAPLNTTAEAAGHAGVAYAMTGLMLALPLHSQRGQCYIPLAELAGSGLTRDQLGRAESISVLREMRMTADHHLQEAQKAVKLLPREIQLAFLPLATVPLNLSGMERNDFCGRHRIEVPQWRKQWAIWRAARKIR